MEVIEIAYLSSFIVGFGFAVISGLLSGVFSGHAEAHVDVGGGHGGDVHATMGDQVHFPLLSPVTLSMFVATFGGSGMIYKRLLNLPLAAHLALASVTAVVVALGVAWFFYKIFQATQGSSEASVADLIGLEAEVITPIPAEGVGEIAYVAKESRYNAPARSTDGKALPSHSVVKIQKILGGIYIVEKAR